MSAIEASYSPDRVAEALLEGVSESVDNIIEVVGFTDEQGEIELPIHVITTGSMMVTVTKHNRLPFRGKLFVFADDTPLKGTTGDKFTFGLAGLAPAGPHEVNINWTHGSLKGNLSLAQDGISPQRSISSCRILLPVICLITATACEGAIL